VHLCGKKNPLTTKEHKVKTQSNTKGKMNQLRLKSKDKNGNPEN
jgi:hypothetical protein